MVASHALLPCWQHSFLKMLPTIRRYAHVAFRHLKGDNRDDAVAEVVANACVAFARLAKQQRPERGFPSALARFAIMQVCGGRRVGTRFHVRDVYSPRLQKEGRRLNRLDRMDHDGWVEAVIEDPRTPVFEQVCFRLDFPLWLSRLTERNRGIALFLAMGHTTRDVAQRFAVSDARISQLRRELYVSWQQFQGDAIATRRYQAASSQYFGRRIVSIRDR